MLTAQRVRRSLYLSVHIAGCLALGMACTDQATGAPGAGEGKASGARVCPECAPVKPGEGSSAMGSQAACVLAYLERSIDADEAEMLGFPVADAATLIERPIDAPMKWVPKPSEGGGAATGYERETRIRGSFKVESYSYNWLDPERCDGTICEIDNETTTEQAPCPERYIMIQVSGDLETLDGAISAQFPLQAVNLRLPGQVDDVVVAAAADLSEVRGSLKIDPDVPPPHVGRLDLSLQFADSQHRGFGALSVGVTPDWDNLSDDARSAVTGPLAYYAPLEAQWGDYPFGEPGTPTVAPGQ